MSDFFPKNTLKKCKSLIRLIKCDFLGSEQSTVWSVDGEEVSIPYRVKAKTLSKLGYALLPKTQKLAYLCILTRHNDGKIRGDAVKQLFANFNDYPVWIYPYILKLCDEYVEQILNDIYVALPKLDTKDFRRIVNENMSNIQLGYNRMVSYWNEYYRSDYPDIDDYVGKKIYDALLKSSTSDNISKN